MKKIFIAFSLATSLTNCGSEDKKTETTPTTSSTVSFEDVKSTISAKCGGSTCHSSTSSGRVVLVDNETNVKNNAATAAAYIRSTSNPMPPSSSSSLTSSEKTQLLTYLDSVK